MGGLFSRKHPPKPKVTQTDMQILELKQIRDKLQQYIKRLEGQMERDRSAAGNLLVQKKLELAKLLLRKKKFLEHLHANAQGELENIERMIETIDLAQLQKDVVQGLKEGNSMLKQLQSAMNIEDVERVMEETREAMEFQKEVSDILSGKLTSTDETDVEKEFDRLLAEQLKTQLPSPPTKVHEPEPELRLPEVPTTAPVRQPSPQPAANSNEERIMVAA